jgi:hypothetical protein
MSEFEFTPASVTKLAQLMLAVHETVKEVAPEGAPEGPMYLAFMQAGYDLETFSRVVGLLVAKGFLRRESNVLYFVKDL